MNYKKVIITRLGFQRNGADFSVFVNTAQEFYGSDSGARPDEAVSWGKIKMDATPVKVIFSLGLLLEIFEMKLLKTVRFYLL